MQAAHVFYPPTQENGLIMLDEEWQRQTEVSERRKAQNRLAQRNFRKRRSQQQQQLNDDQTKVGSNSESASAGSYPSPQPSPETLKRSTKSPEHDTRGNGSRNGKSRPASSSSSSTHPVSPQTVMSPSFSSFDVTYQMGQPGAIGQVFPGPFDNQFNGSVSSSPYNQPLAYDSGIYDTQYSGSMLGSGIRPAVIPRTEAGKDVRRSAASGMSIDLTQLQSPSQLQPNTSFVGSTIPAHTLSPGLQSYPTGQMSLHLSAEKGHEGVVQLLLDCGADPNTRDDYGSTPLHLAAKNGNEIVVQALLNKGADVNAKNGSGWSAVHIASKYGHENILRLLIHRGADLHAKATEAS